MCFRSFEKIGNCNLHFLQISAVYLLSERLAEFGPLVLSACMLQPRCHFREQGRGHQARAYPAPRLEMCSL